MEHGSKTHDELDRPDDNRLLENYSLHDTGHEHIVPLLDGWSFDIEDWGLDKRENTGQIVYDDRMDFRVWDGARLAGLVDVKTKTNESWVGTFNERHYDHYADYADSLSCPVVVAMYLLEGEEVAAEHYIPIVGDYIEIEEKGVAPDGNRIVTVDESYYRSREWLRNRLTE